MISLKMNLEIIPDSFIKDLPRSYCKISAGEFLYPGMGMRFTLKLLLFTSGLFKEAILHLNPP
jgi:hypothetical protein